MSKINLIFIKCLNINSLILIPAFSIKMRFKFIILKFVKPDPIYFGSFMFLTNKHYQWFYSPFSFLNPMNKYVLSIWQCWKRTMLLCKKFQKSDEWIYPWGSHKYFFFGGVNNQVGFSEESIILGPRIRPIYRLVAGLSVQIWNFLASTEWNQLSSIVISRTEHYFWILITRWADQLSQRMFRCI